MADIKLEATKSLRAMREIKTCGQCGCCTFPGCRRLAYMVHSGEIAQGEYDPSHCMPDSPACDWAQFVGVDRNESDELTNVAAAKTVWHDLADLTVDEKNVIDVPFFDPYIGFLEAGDACPEDIWHEIEDVYGVSVAWLMYSEDEG